LGEKHTPGNVFCFQLQASKDWLDLSYVMRVGTIRELRWQAALSFSQKLTEGECRLKRIYFQHDARLITCQRSFASQHVAINDLDNCRQFVFGTRKKV